MKVLVACEFSGVVRDDPNHTCLCAQLKVRISELEAALHKIIDEGDYTAPEGMKRIALTALETK